MALSSSTPIKKITFNFASTALSGGIARVLSLLSAAYLARVLGPTTFGQVSFAEALVMFLMLVSDVGLQTIGVRQIARSRNNPESSAHLVRNIIGIELIVVTVIFCFLTVIVWGIASFDQNTKLLITLYGIALLLPFPFVIEWWLNGREQMVYVGFARIVRELLFFCGVLLLVQNSSLVALTPIAQGVASLVVLSFVLLYFVKTYKRLPLPYIALGEWRLLLRSSWSIGLAGFVNHLSLRVGVIMLGWISVEEAVSMYSAPWKIVVFGYELSSVLALAIFPALSRAYLGAHGMVKRYFLGYQLLTIGLATLTMVIALWGSTTFIQTVYGSAYIDSVIPFRWLLVGLSWLMISAPSTSTLLVADRGKLVLLAGAIGALTHVLANLVLIPVSAQVGAAQAFALSSFTNCTLVAVFCWRHLAAINSTRATNNLVSPE